MKIMPGMLLLLPLLAVVISMVAGAITMLIPQLSQSLLGAINAANNVYALLIEIPRPLWDNNIYLFPQLIESNPISGYSNFIGTSMTNFYAASRMASFILLVFVIIIAGISYFLQNFKIVSEGTAMRVFTGSIMCIVLIYLFPPIYDAIAALVNSLTYPSPYGILKPGMINEILLHASTIIPTSLDDVGSALVGIFMNLMLFIFTLITYVSLVIMGILRIFFIGATFALMPILLVLRLLPFIDKIADVFIQVIVGGILASIIVSLFFAFGYDVITSPTISGLMKTLISIGILMSSSLMLTFLIPTLGSMMSTITTAITGAITGATIGGVAITTGAAAGAYQAGQLLVPLIQAGAITKRTAMLRGIGSALGGAIGTFGTIAPRMMPGMTSFGIPIALSIGKEAASFASFKLPEIDEVEAGEALILKAAATPHDKEHDIHEMEKWGERVKTMLLNRPPEIIGQEIAKMIGMRIKNPEAIGRRVQERIYEIMDATKGDLLTQRILLSRIGRAYSIWKERTIELLIPDNEGNMISLDEYVDKVAKKALEAKNIPADRYEEEIQKMKNYIRNTVAKRKGIVGLSPLTLYSALRERKSNSDKISDFIIKRRGILTKDYEAESFFKSLEKS
ncbi:MAG: hypothetical protein NZ922_04430 [Candidatus Methanomethyliaceae archaeon]|nr:hypothetical protein [Candidatus Methanomethyliaceae archaeon]MDW7971308.1 hypothetical protein [Nitrososphaerota archaeon]